MKGLALFVALCATLPARADGDRTNVPLTPQYKSECGSCHVAFPPSLLGRAAWQKTMARLERHFGTDAGVDAATRDAIQRYLERNARQRELRPAAPEPRVTGTAWFTREHAEVPEAAWKDPRVKRAANCAACHRGAEDGRYAEAEIAIPGMRHRREED